MEMRNRLRAQRILGSACVAAVILLATGAALEGWIRSSENPASPFLEATSATQVDLGALAPNAEYPVSFTVKNNAQSADHDFGGKLLLLMYCGCQRVSHGGPAKSFCRCPFCDSQPSSTRR